MTENTEVVQDVNFTFSKDDAYKILEMTNNWISNIDTKVSFALTLSVALIGFIFSKSLPNVFKVISGVSKLKELTLALIIGAILVSMLYTVSFISIIYFILSIIARIKHPNNIDSVFFFGSIAEMEFLDYKMKVNNMNEKEILEGLKKQIHINSVICNKKVKYYNIGIKLLGTTIILWFVCMLFKLI